MLVRRRGRLLATGLAAFVLAATTAGCGGGEPASTSGRLDSTPADNLTTSPTPSAVTSTPAEPPSEPTGPATTATSTPPESNATLLDRLLTADELPAPDAATAWAEAQTRRSETPTSTGTCQKFGLLSIGATKVVTRTYHPADAQAPATASGTVAQFADEMTARRAYEVLKSWRGQCDEALADHDEHRVGELRSVPVAGGGIGDWYLLTYRDATTGAVADAQGFTRVGNRIATLQMKVTGQDTTQPPSKHPMAAAVRSAADQLG